MGTFQHTDEDRSGSVRTTLLQSSLVKCLVRILKTVALTQGNLSDQGNVMEMKN